MKFTFIYENGKRENKTVTVTFDGSSGEKSIFNNFLDFMKAIGYTYDKSDVLRIVKERTSFSDPVFGAVPPLNIDANNYDEYFDGLPGISYRDFKNKNQTKTDMSHGHGMRGPFVGPADC